jgi:hypothetical protein
MFEPHERSNYCRLADHQTPWAQREQASARSGETFGQALARYQKLSEDGDPSLAAKAGKRVAKIFLYQQKAASAVEVAYRMEQRFAGKATECPSAAVDAYLVRAYVARHVGDSETTHASLWRAATTLEAEGTTELDRVNVGLETSNYLRYSDRFTEAVGLLSALPGAMAEYEAKAAALVHYKGSNLCELLQWYLPSNRDPDAWAGPSAAQGIVELHEEAMSVFQPASEQGQLFQAFRDKHLATLKGWRALTGFQARRDSREALSALHRSRQHLTRAEAEFSRMGVSRGVSLCRLGAVEISYMEWLVGGKITAPSLVGAFSAISDLPLSRLRERLRVAMAKAYLALGRRAAGLRALEGLVPTAFPSELAQEQVAALLAPLNEQVGIMSSPRARAEVVDLLQMVRRPDTKLPDRRSYIGQILAALKRPEIRHPFGGREVVDIKDRYEQEGAYKPGAHDKTGDLVAERDRILDGARTFAEWTAARYVLGDSDDRRATPERLRASKYDSAQERWAERAALEYLRTGLARASLYERLLVAHVVLGSAEALWQLNPKVVPSSSLSTLRRHLISDYSPARRLALDAEVVGALEKEIQDQYDDASQLESLFA